MSVRAASRFQHSAQRAALGARLFPEIRTTAPCRSSGAAGDPVLRDPAADDSNVAQPAPPGAHDQAGGDTSSPPPATFDVTLSAELLLTLRMAATAEQIDIGEALRRAIASYADGLGLQVLASALDLDPDLAMEFRQRAGLNRVRGASP